MIQALIQGSDFKALAEFVSPNFFSVVPMRQCFSVLTGVFRQSRDHHAVANARQASQLALSELGVEIRDPNAGEKRRSDKADPERVLRAYFKQLLDSPSWLLDFRKVTWETEGSLLVWRPSRHFHEPSPAFRGAVAGLYRGFYKGDQALFRVSLAALGLEAAESQIVAQFGSGEQVQVQFSLPRLQRSFSEIFKACSDAGSRIHPEFALLGAMLLSLYDVLGEQGRAYDVRRAFLDVAGE